MLFKLKDKYFVLSFISVFMFVLLFMRLVKLQIVDAEMYLAKSESYLSSEETIPAPRGKILDRYGRPIVTNRLGFSVAFSNANLSNDEINDLILNTISLFRSNDDDYIDTFPIVYEDDKYIFKYNNLTGDNLETKIRNTKFNLGISDNLNADECIEVLKEKFGLDNRYTKEEVRDILAMRYEMHYRNFFSGTPFTFASDVSMNTISAIEENKDLYIGLKVSTSPVRNYIYGNVASHILGRVDIIYQEEYEALKDEGYGLNAVIGKDGMEKILERQIRGKDGKKSLSLSVGEDPKITETPAIAGNNAMLTIDIDIQLAAEKALKETIDNIKYTSYTKANNAGSDVGGGSVVVQDVETGEILAMASYPDFNIDHFTKDYEKLSNDKSNPLLNRAISGVYPPGSVFKMLTTIAGLEEGVIDSNTVIYDEGVYEYYGQKFNCWIYTDTHSTHGAMDAANALKNSCNYYYYEVGKRLGVDKLVEYGRKMNLGEKTGIELEGEVAGVLANQEYKQLNFNEIWYPGDTLQMSIGQSYNLFTPLQLVGYTSTIANRGTIYRPYLTKSIRNSQNGELISDTKPEVKSNVSIKDSTYEAVTTGMRLVSYNGTASATFGNYPIEVCSKTGSSQVNGGSANGVFVSYAPYKNPKIAVSVVIENAGSGSITAPIAKAVYDAYFKLNSNTTGGTVIKDNTLVS